MKPEGSFIAVRVIAQHCPELLRGTRRASNPLSELAQLGEALQDMLVRELGSLCAGAKVEVSWDMQAGKHEASKVTLAK